MPSQNVIVISHDVETQNGLASTLGRCGCVPIVATSIQEAISILKRNPVDLIFCSEELPGDEIEDFVRRASRPPGGISVVIVSRSGDWKRYVEFLQLGAFDYVLYPPNGDEIERVARTALRGGVMPKVDAKTWVV